MVGEFGGCLVCRRSASGKPGRVYCGRHTHKSIGGFPVTPIQNRPPEDRRAMEDPPTLRHPPRMRPLPVLCRIRIHAWMPVGIGPHESYEEHVCLRCGVTKVR